MVYFTPKAFNYLPSGMRFANPRLAVGTAPHPRSRFSCRRMARHGGSERCGWFCHPKAPVPQFLLILYISSRWTVLGKDLKNINVCVYNSQGNKTDPRSLLSLEPSFNIFPLITDSTCPVRRARMSQGHTWQTPSQTPTCTESHVGASGIPTPASLLGASRFLKKNQICVVVGGLPSPQI